MVYFQYIYLSGAGLDNSRHNTLVPSTDVLEFSDYYLIKCDMPGIEIKDLCLEVSDSSILITALASLDPPASLCLHAMEFSNTNYRIQLTLPPDADAENFSVTYEYGVLNLTLPKKMY